MLLRACCAPCSSRTARASMHMVTLLPPPPLLPPAHCPGCDCGVAPAAGVQRTARPQCAHAWLPRADGLWPARGLGHRGRNRCARAHTRAHAHTHSRLLWLHAFSQHAQLSQHPRRSPCARRPGSEFKIDASYLSPNVNLASRLEAATKQYRVPLLLSRDFVDCLSPAVAAKVRAGRTCLPARQRPARAPCMHHNHVPAGGCPASAAGAPGGLRDGQGQQAAAGAVCVRP